MKDFNSLNSDEKQDIIKNANNYYIKNKPLIDVQLIKYNFSIEPDFNQLHQPNTWMPAQWKWFTQLKFNNKKSIFDQIKSLF